MGGGDDAEGGALVAKAAVESHIAAVVREESTRLHPAPASPASPDAGAKKKLGTIKGVFVPTMQNILGVILFLRVPFIVGQAGILEGLAIVWLSCATTLLTSISMSAIATNGVPRGGGCYTMIKNALGAQFGGVTGTLLFLSNTFGVAIARARPGVRRGALAPAGDAVSAARRAAQARARLRRGRARRRRLLPAPASLGDPFIVSSIAWPSDKLVCVGVLLSTLGAGLQSLAGAPRLLAAIGRDGLIRRRARRPRRRLEPRLALALCACLSCCCVMLGSLDAVAPFITLCPAGAGDAGDDGDAVEFELAPLTPGGADARDPTDSQRARAASAEGVADWRSGLRFKRARCWLERRRCARARARSPPADAGGIAARRRRRARPRSPAPRAQALEAGDIQFKYWRPFVLFLCKLDPVGDVSYVPQAGMINMIAQLMRRGKGLALVNGVVPAPRIDADVVACAQRARRNLRATLRERGVEGFADVVVAASVVEGQRRRQRLLLQAKGLGHFRPNTVAVGWPDRRREGAGFDAGGFASIVDDAHAVGKTVLVCSGAVDYPDGRDGARVLDGGTIDVWWVFDLFPAGGLLLLLPFLLKKDRVWARCKMRLIVVSPRGADEARLEAAVRAMLRAGGVIADVVLLEVDAKDAPRYAPGLDAQHSRRAKAPDVRDSITKYVGDAALGAADVRVDDGDGGAPAAAPSKLTGLIAARSGGAELVVISLPKRRANATAAAWMDSVDTMIRGLRRVILVKESGQEKVQFFQ
ncbi:potassium:chloride symporter [Aureococcus anophagefferens]|uniref:Potassium:chloride symporter n=1 Tax=Aureococcus anophagefferens TaxID=44056 RepID=A0ABR1G6X6_AURAN